MAYPMTPACTKVSAAISPWATLAERGAGRGAGTGAVKERPARRLKTKYVLNLITTSVVLEISSTYCEFI